MEGIEELADGNICLKARVHAVPEKGKANKALVKLIADYLKVPKSSISVVAGHTSRIKTLEISADTAMVKSRLLNIG